MMQAELNVEEIVRDRSLKVKVTVCSVTIMIRVQHISPNQTGFRICANKHKQYWYS